MNIVAHTNGAVVFSKTKKSVQQSVSARYILPTDQPYLYLDSNNVPFVQEPKSPRMACTIRKSALIDGGFHK
jgi:hypothetical protein